MIDRTKGRDFGRFRTGKKERQDIDITCFFFNKSSTPTGSVEVECDVLAAFSHQSETCFRFFMPVPTNE